MKFRTRLTLLIGLVVAALMSVTGAALVSSGQRLVLNSIDHDLVDHARGFADHSGGPGRGPREAGPPPGIPRRFPTDDGLRPRIVASDGENDPAHGAAIDPDAVKRAQRGAPVLSEVTREGSHLRVATLVTREGSVVQSAYDLGDYERARSTEFGLLTVLIPLSVLIAAVAGWVLADQAVRPVERVTSAVASMDHESLKARLEVEGNDEIAALATQFNLMSSRLETSFAQRETLVRRLESLLQSQKTFVGDASHELRTPLARLKLIASAALAQNHDLPGLRAALQKVDKGVDDMTALVQQLLTLARQEASSAPSFDCSTAEIVREALELAAVSPGPTPLVIPGPEAIVNCRLADLVRGVANVIENAKRYAPAAPARISWSVDSDRVYVRVEDDGPGVPPELLPHLTERFFRADSARSREVGGTGLGLAITKAAAEASGGTLEIESEVGRGTTVVLSLPLSPSKVVG